MTRHRPARNNRTLKIPDVLRIPSRIQISDAKVPMVFDSLLFMACNDCVRMFAILYFGEFGEISTWMILWGFTDVSGRAV
jgi:hypothetical protein